MQDFEPLFVAARQAIAAGHRDQARDLYAKAADKARAVGAAIPLAHALRHVSDLDREAGRAEPALAAADEAVALYRASPDATDLDLANALRLSALAREALGQAATDLWREAGALYQDADVEAGVEEVARRLNLATRAAEPEDLAPLARLWREGWSDAHNGIVPEALVALRTPESFEERMAKALPQVRALGPVGAPLGFHLIKGDELNQFYLASAARGTGAAGVLMADAEMRLAEAGVATAWLACAIGNTRAARFYEKAGWTRAGVETVPTETSEGSFPLEVWRYEKRLAIDAL
ncbi:N-acetyltransferase [Caulobacter segnis]|uniref:GCN5-related N-acetyltransferase n=2 Tax=Caulobacter segnis TaxID=88688 RepID=D5VNB2_CAUST|nr:GNAT family N-acetyltransferase [Caulobacter segnis]ADG11985.1 GCN5-related N-acetyltransferase [Caulobacter segnis ATCC 21756]AVQ03606.1 N-acetyltransferase [Caulobacter segnis]